MKRSEVVSVMHAFVSQVLCTTEEFTKEDCSALLSKIEEAGILPPVDKENFLEKVMVKIEEEHRENHGYDIGSKRAYYAKRGAVLAVKTKWEEE